MIALRLSEICAIVSGTLHGPDALITGPVVTDSREARAGSLYVARVGEHADGHEFASGAAKAGAVATLGSRPVETMSTIVVADVQEAFAALSRAVIERVPGLNIVGITGSSGKTSTKDMLGQVLAEDGPTIAPQGSYNSEVGVPLTVCRIEADTRHLVVEMGASGVGHIAYLTQIAPPRIGIVLNVGHAHVGEFESIDQIADTKAALVEALPTDGVAIVNLDDARVAAMASRTAARVIGVGYGMDADYRAVDVELDETGRARFTLVTTASRTPVSLAVHGEHHVRNALAVLAAAVESGIDLRDAVRAVGAAAAQSRWRMEVYQLADGITLVNDAYNANP
ncbi:MAG: UDP-N-acetylmuramoyl-tripeptide--D-alanyl-D-alanine ligase, partial [Allobranchiibius sp.]